MTSPTSLVVKPNITLTLKSERRLDGDIVVSYYEGEDEREYRCMKSADGHEDWVVFPLRQ
jgi:hypothetical protein